MELKQYKYEKVEVDSKNWDLPTEPQYFFETGIRRSIAVVPEWTSWNVEQKGQPEEIWKLNIICVYQSFEAKIETFSIQVSSIGDNYHRAHQTSKTGDSFIVGLIDGHYLERTKERFDTDFNNCLKKIQDNLPK